MDMANVDLLLAVTGIGDHGMVENQSFIAVLSGSKHYHVNRLLFYSLASSVPFPINSFLLLVCFLLHHIACKSCLFCSNFVNNLSFLIWSMVFFSVHGPCVPSAFSYRPHCCGFCFLKTLICFSCMLESNSWLLTCHLIWKCHHAMSCISKS